MKIAQVLLSLILSLALLACSHNSGNVNENHKEQQLLLSKHISNEQINGFMEDRFGQMWISTFRGLNKYDGNTFHQYYCIDDSIGLPDNARQQREILLPRLAGTTMGVDRQRTMPIQWQ